MDAHLIRNPILLIGGTGRSGTTIFRKIMELHPDIATIPEWRILTDPNGIIEYLTIIKKGNPSMCDQAFRRLRDMLKDVANPSYLSRFIIKFFAKYELISPYRLTSRYYSISAEKELPGFSRIANVLLESLTDFQWKGQYAGLQLGQSRKIAGILGNVEAAEKAFREFLYSIASMAMWKKKKTRFMEKNTWSLLHFDTVSRLYPNGKLVHIHRDPRDVVSSFIKQNWMPSDPIKSAYILKRLFELWWEVKARVDESRWMEISLNDLVNDTENVLRRVCNFWQIDFNPCLLSIDLSHSNAGRWKIDLSHSQQEKIEKVLDEIIEYYGY
jgi:hypothetical protein